MEKEHVIAELEKVFIRACTRYEKTNSPSITEIRELGEVIIRSKQDIARDVKKAEEFIENRMKASRLVDLKAVSEELNKLSKRQGSCF
ncbi:MAG: hypothetical protein R3328_00270 [Planococcaceae bacterium]|nr:hypothetical protein [Planococcaceae bacterium]